MNNNKGVFSEVEKNRADRHRIKKTQSYWMLLVIATLVGGFSMILTNTDTFSKNFFVMSPVELFKGNLSAYDFHIVYYAILILYIAIIWKGLVLKKPIFKKGGVIRKIFYYIFYPLNLLWNLYLKLHCKLDKDKKITENDTLLNFILEILYLPVNLFIFIYDETKPYKFKALWYDHIEKKFFRRTHKKVDEIRRVSELVVLKKFDKIFTRAEWEKLERLFISKDTLEDYLKITEGYLTDSSERKFDEVFSTNKVSLLKNFRAFNGKDKVYFSMEYIIYKCKEQEKFFRQFLQERFLKSSTRVSAEILTFFKYVVNDTLFEYNLVGVTKEELEKGNRYTKEEKAKLRIEINNIRKAKEKGDLKFIESLIVERLVIWFKFYLARTILQRYCNIPSGLLVVKLQDYSMRMITEIYADLKVINIAKNQNDGLSDSFKGDGLVNLFLYIYNAFLYGRKEKILNKIEWNINTISDPASLYDEEISSIVTNMENEIKDHSEYLKESSKKSKEYSKETSENSEKSNKN